MSRGSASYGRPGSKESQSQDLRSLRLTFNKKYNFLGDFTQLFRQRQRECDSYQPNQPNLEEMYGPELQENSTLSDTRPGHCLSGLHHQSSVKAYSAFQRQWLINSQGRVATRLIFCSFMTTFIYFTLLLSSAGSTGVL